MWNREWLKTRAKINFKKSYKQAVIVCLIVYLITAIFDGGYNSANTHMQNTMRNEQIQYNSTDELNQDDEFIADIFTQGVIATFFENIFNTINNDIHSTSSTVIVLIMICIMLITTLLKVFIVNPIIVGKNNFFMGIRENERKIGDIFLLFDKEKFIRPTMTMLLIDIFIFLWALLLIIPGIIKSYEYKMVPYILSENPYIDRKRAFELSRIMMNGQKGSAFVLDLSFIGWQILSGLTLGILGILYVNPYIESTYAELYAVLRESAIQSKYTDNNELPGFNL